MALPSGADVAQNTSEQKQPENAPASETPKSDAQKSETPSSDTRRDSSDQDNRRNRNNNNRGRNRGRRGRGREDYRNRNDNNERNRQDDNRGRNEDQRNRNDDRAKERDAQPPEASEPSLVEVLGASWTEEKTREYLNDGILARLSPGLVEGHGEALEDLEKLKGPLKAIRAILSDECMVADDVADIMLLDVVMGALSDRIEVCRLQAKAQSLQDMNVLLEMRCKADKRLIEAVNALKNA